MSANLDGKIQKLTNKLHKHCAGEDVGVVIGAGFNIVQTAINAIPDKRVLSAIAATLRDQALMIEAMVSGGKH